MHEDCAELSEMENKMSASPAKGEGMDCHSEEWREAVKELLMEKCMLKKAARWVACWYEYFYAACDKEPVKHPPTVIPLCCGLRICPRCVKLEWMRVVKSFEPFFKAIREGKFGGKYGYRFKHLMLSARREEHVDLQEQLRNLMGNAKKLLYHFWARGGWKGRGAVMTAEIGPKGGNVHVHVFLYGQYVDVHDISDKWEELTGNCVVWITRCGVGRLAYVIKYPYKVNGISPQQAVDFLVALDGFKRMRTYGIFYGKRYRDLGSGDGIKCPICGSSTTIMSPSFYEEQFDVIPEYIPSVWEAICRMRGRWARPP